jgi:formyl-CoA transferase
MARGRNQVELDARISAWTGQHSVEEVEALMIEHGIPAGRIYKPADMLADPHFQAREAIVEVDHPHWQNLKMQNVFPKLSKTPGSIRSIAPQTVGQDNGSVYAELGIDADALSALHEGGVV